MRRAAVALSVAALALALPAPAGAQTSPAACDPGPVQLVGGGDTRLLAGQEHVQGYLLRRTLGAGRSCVVPGATVELLARNVGTTGARVVRTATTDGAGRVQFRVRPPHSVVLTARSVQTERFPAAAAAPAVLSVATRVTLSRRALPDCRVSVGGRTFPAKPGTPVEVHREPRQQASTRVGRFGVRADGTWAGTVRLPCGSADHLVATIQQTASNDWGSSDSRIEVARRTRECGTAPTASGSVGGSLTQTLEVFNTTTAVGGAWWAERVVANRTDRTIRFDSYSTDTYRLLRRGTAVVIGQNATSDAIQVVEHELEPGEELRERIELVAANCLLEPEPGVGYFGLPPGPAFPAGTRVVGVGLLPTDQGTSVSDRVALSVS